MCQMNLYDSFKIYFYSLSSETQTLSVAHSIPDGKYLDNPTKNFLVVEKRFYIGSNLYKSSTVEPL